MCVICEYVNTWNVYSRKSSFIKKQNKNQIEENLFVKNISFKIT